MTNDEYVSMRKYMLNQCRGYWHGFTGNKSYWQQGLADLRSVRSLVKG